jgi:hypothetical protein
LDLDGVAASTAAPARRTLRGARAALLRRAGRRRLLGCENRSKRDAERRQDKTQHTHRRLPM